MAGPEIQPRRKPRFRERHAVHTPPVAAEPRPLRPIAETATTVQRPVARRDVLLAHVTTERALFFLIVLAGFSIRIWDVGSRAMHGDEAEHAWFAWHLYSGTGYQYDPVYHGPLQFIVTAAFFFLFGVSNTTARLMAVLFGTALVALPYFFRPWMGRVAALVASTYIAFSPAFVYVSRLERDDIFSCFFAGLLALCIFGYRESRRVRYIYIGAAALALSLAAMENTYITAFMFGSYMALVVAAELAAGHAISQHVSKFWRRTGSESAFSDRFLATSGAALVLLFALTVVTGSGIPFLLGIGSAIALLVLRQGTFDVGSDSLSGLTPAIRSVRWQHWLNALTIAVAIIFITFSTFGTNLRGIWDASQPLLNTKNVCPGNSYVLNGCRKDVIGGLFYWLSQHQVHRGGQPWFYYSLLFGLYEQFAIFFGLGGMVWFARKPSRFTTFLTYWAILSFAIYSWAGEKFPWLMIHPLLPFAFLSAMFAVEIVRVAWRARWVLTAVLSVIAAVELHNMYEVNFVYGADPVEMMVYVQNAPDTQMVAGRIAAVSNKLTNGNSLQATIDANDAWPFAWYLRDYPDIGYPTYPSLLQKPYSNAPVIIVDAAHQAALFPSLKGKYSGHEYILRWWFPEDYKTLTWASAAQSAVDPGHWNVIAQWFLTRRPFGPKQSEDFFYYVKNGVVTPY